MKGKTLKPKAFKIICGLSLCLCFVLSGSAQAQSQQPTAPSPQLSRYEGFTQPSRELPVESYLDGVLQTLHVKTGDTFAAGDLLVSLDDSIQALAVEVARLRSISEAEINVAHARVSEAEVELENQTALAANGSATDRDVRRAQASLDIAQAELQQAHENQAQAVVQYQMERERLDLYTIRAPFDGEVLAVATSEGAEEGAALRQNDPIMHIARLDPLVAKISLPQSVVDQLQVGQSYPLAIGVREDATAATLTRIASEADLGSQLIEVEFEMANPAGAMRSGVRCRLLDLRLPVLTAE